MTPFDFSTLPNGHALPIIEKEFQFDLPGPHPSAAAVDKRGVHCGYFAVMQIYNAVNAIDLTVINGADGATITASNASGSLSDSKNVASAPGMQTIRFDFEGIRLIVFESPGNELYVKSLK